MKEILEYCGDIHQVRRWTQELLAYHFRILHRPARMMRDVDGLNRRFDNPLIEQHCTVALALRIRDELARPAAYDSATFHSSDPLKCRNTIPLVLSTSAAPVTLAITPSHLIAVPFTTISNLPIRL